MVREGNTGNAKQNGVRIIHPPSGARAEHRDGRDQHKNKEEAFKKLCNTKEFLAWHRMEVARRLGHLKAIERAVDEAVDRAVAEGNLKIEYGMAYISGKEEK